MRKGFFNTLMMAVALVPAVVVGNAQAASASSSDKSGGYDRRVDPYTNGQRTVFGPRDPYTQGARLDKRDPFTDGARVGKVDPFTDGSRAQAE